MLRNCTSLAFQLFNVLRLLCIVLFNVWVYYIVTLHSNRILV